MQCKDCDWFQRGHSFHDRGVCIARGVYEYPNHWCWLKKENAKQTDQDNVATDRTAHNDVERENEL